LLIAVHSLFVAGNGICRGRREIEKFRTGRLGSSVAAGQPGDCRHRVAPDDTRFAAMRGLVVARR
jgi:hypothetical protein